MKKGFFKTLTALFLGLFLVQLSGCATLFDLVAEDNPADYDRGYSVEAQEEEEEVADTFADEGADRAPAGLSHGKVRVKRAIETRDIILGMTRQDVMQSWGEPVQREVAGNGGSGHERWTYGSRYNFNRARTVIFENGRVAGWNR